MTALTDTSGAVVERYVYDPYGNVTIYNPAWTSEVAWSAGKKNEVLYAGYRYDAETGLYNVRHREYHPTLGRFIQRDSVGYSAGMNLYSYASASPLTGSDPLGLCPQEGSQSGVATGKDPEQEQIETKKRDLKAKEDRRTAMKQAYENWKKRYEAKEKQIQADLAKARADYQFAQGVVKAAATRLSDLAKLQLLAQAMSNQAVFEGIERFLSPEGVMEQEIEGTAVDLILTKLGGAVLSSAGKVAQTLYDALQAARAIQDASRRKAEVDRAIQQEDPWTAYRQALDMASEAADKLGYFYKQFSVLYLEMNAESNAYFKARDALEAQIGEDKKEIVREELRREAKKTVEQWNRDRQNKEIGDRLRRALKAGGYL